GPRHGRADGRLLRLPRRPRHPGPRARDAGAVHVRGERRVGASLSRDPRAARREGRTMSAAPYSDAWREHTRARMLAHGMHSESVALRCGLEVRDAVEALRGYGPVSLEVAGPIDELLERLDAGIERSCAARGLRPVEVRVGPVLTDAGEL